MYSGRGRHTLNNKQYISELYGILKDYRYDEEKEKVNQGEGEWYEGEWITDSKRTDRIGHREKVISEQRLEGSE